MTKGLRFHSRPLEPGNDWLPDGRRVWWQSDEFGCLRCAIATLLGCDLEEVPPAPAGEHTKAEELEATAALHAWAFERGLRVRYRDLGPALLRGGWIGVSVDPRPGFDHTVVMDGDTLVFDPALAVPVPAGFQVAPVTELHYAITFEPLGGNDERTDR